MSFGAGMGAGMGAGVGLGMGVSAGKKRACEEIREYVQANGLTIHDSQGAVVDIDAFLSHAVDQRSSDGQRSKFLLAVLLLLGLAVFGIVSYFVFS